MTEVPPVGIRTAVVGTGYALRVAAPLYRSKQAFTLAAVVGREADRARALLAKAHLPPELACTMTDLIGRDDVSLVHVASPNACHEEQIRQLIEHPATLLLEKPLSLDDGRQRELGNTLSHRASPTFVNFPLRAAGMPVLAVPVGEKSRAEVKLSSPFDRRYVGIDTWKTVEARGGGARHILLPHLCDYVLQLVRRLGEHLDGIYVALDVDARGTSERLDVTVRCRGSHIVTCSTPTPATPHEDTFQLLFERSLHSLAVAVVSGADEAPERTIDTIPLADVDDVILAYRLIEVLEDHPGRRRQPLLAWQLDRNDIAELYKWVASNKRSTERMNCPGSVVVGPA